MNSSSSWEFVLNNSHKSSTTSSPFLIFYTKKYCERHHIFLWVYPTTAINHLLCLISLVMALLIIYRYYTSTKSIINKVRYSSTAATIFWTLSNIAWVINWHHEPFFCANYYNLTFSKNIIVSDQIFMYSRQIAILTQATGYFFFALSFLYRLIYSFKDSFFQISNCCKNSAIFGLVTMPSMFVVALIFNTIWFLQYEFETILTMFLCVGMIIYIIASIIAVRVLIIKLFQFKTFIEGKKQKVNNRAAQDLYKLIKRLTVLYLVALLSTLGMFFIVVVFVIMVFVLYVIESIVYWETVPIIIIVFMFRGLAVVDSTINIICLFFQNDVASSMYYKYCAVCDRHITKCCCCCHCYNKQTTNDTHQLRIVINLR